MTTPTKEQQKAREDAAKAEASDDVAAAKLRINEQSALMMTVDELRKNKATNNQADVERINKQYNNFCTFRPNNGGGGHISLTNKVYRPKSTKYLFDSIPPHVISSLLPSIKLYKVFIPEKDKEGRQSSGFSWAVPFEDVPFSYGSDREITSNNKINQNIETLLKGESRGNSIGIKSFRYKFVGTNPAEVNTNIEASLEIFFQDVRDLVKEINFDQTHPNFTETPPSRQYNFAYTDLAVDVSSTKNKGLEYNEQYFRLKAVIGYATPPANYLEKLIEDPEERENAKRAIENTKVILYLNPHNHDITFEENGTITLKIQYIAAMTSTLASLDALAISPKHDELKKAQQAYDEASTQEKQEIDKIKSNCEPNKFSSEKEREEALKTKEGEARAKLFDQQNQLENLQISTYSDIFQRLLGAPPYNNSGGKIFAATYDEYALGVSSEGVGEADVLQDSAQRRIQNIGKSRMYTSYVLESITADDLKTLKLGSAPSQVKTPRTGLFGGGNPDPESQETAAKKAQEAIEKAQPTGAKDVGGGNYKVKFVFLGDLFDIFCECLKDIKNPSERPRIILSDFNIEIPTTSQVGTNPIDIYNTDAGYNKISINIADIPISLNMLQNFFLEKMIKPRKSSYPLVSIINDIMTDVVIPSVAPSVFGRKTVINKAIRLSTLNMTIPFVGNTDGVTGKDINDPFFGSLNENSFNGRDVSGNTALFPDKNFGNYLVLYCSNQLPEDILKGNGDIKKDEEVGIYHFFIGTDSGIIKKVSFSRTNTPFYKEAKAQSSSGDKSLGRLREVYDCKINMFGNNVYRPGDFIYIEPLFFTGTTAVLLQNRLGLGGYYQIIDVETSINENIFETNLSAVLAGYIDENNKVVSANSKGPC